MTHILSNLTEEYKNIVEELEYKIDGEIETFTIKSIKDDTAENYAKNECTDINKSSKPKYYFSKWKYMK